ncbi:hypothetical protein HFO68_31980 [Rhizobium laguerreae]|uniref:hypothetical protein n=1 Tax=Rhizobium laguerreae TaxID=1076926 RepID=UPI001C900180|nr:hypothetical protein [Rhizobium laguerreae]MBY3075144.1 hypothetical protein [Rhizobium laguerreae]MBY3093539.1 hypothetical protein [Rhizobium laguerreae]MBY3101986.1 hypothetical protein [Rhizobium laguerreae]MBY3109126.1 hypothetical protein [Rhizobium laguerreae]MBY3143444.1 hypothetical protein [Rhizobium laguerreae]
MIHFSFARGERVLLKNDAVLDCPGMAEKPEILTCDVDPDFICLKETNDTGFIFLSEETKCCIASFMVIMGGDVNSELFH